MHRLQKIFIAGNRACAFTILPLSFAFVILGKSIIEVWVGRKYVALGYPVLLALILPYTLMLVQSASSRILFGMSRHGTFAVITLVEGVANVIFSILLVRRFGILGDAFGTAIPLAATYLVFMPRHMCSKLNIPVFTYIRQAYLLPLLLCLPAAFILFAMQRISAAHTYRQLIPQLVVAGSVYCTCLWWAYTTNRALHVGDLGRPSIIPDAETAAITGVQSPQDF